MANPAEAEADSVEEERRRRRIELAVWALIVAHDVLRLVAEVLNR